MTLGLPQDLTWYKLLSDQGSLIGGFFALVAGVLAYMAGRVQASATRSAAQMQIDHEVDALRKSLATEVRQLNLRALTAHKLLWKLSNKSDGSITAWEVENASQVPTPAVYLGSASKIGLLKDDTMDVMIFYSCFDTASTNAAQLMRYRTPDNIPRTGVAGVADAFLQVCALAPEVLSKLKTGVPAHDDKDREVIEMISSAVSASTRKP